MTTAPWRPFATVATIVFDQGRYLMVEELIDGRRVLNQPAGHIDAGESIQEAALRETLEETAWQVELTAFLGVYVLRFAGRDDAYHRYCFLARPLRATGRPLDTGIIAAHWLSYEEITTGNLALRSTLVQRCIDDHRQGRRFPLDLIVEQR